MRYQFDGRTHPGSRSAASASPAAGPTRSRRRGVDKAVADRGRVGGTGGRGWCAGWCVRHLRAIRYAGDRQVETGDAGAPVEVQRSLGRSVPRSLRDAPARSSAVACGDRPRHSRVGDRATLASAQRQTCGERRARSPGRAAFPVRPQCRVRWCDSWHSSCISDTRCAQDLSHHDVPNLGGCRC